MTSETLSILAAFVADPYEEHFGLELSREAGLAPGTIYPILARLLSAGWLERRWEEIDPSVEGRPRRRLYRLTPTGRVEARRRIDERIAALRAAERGTAGASPRTA